MSTPATGSTWSLRRLTNVCFLGTLFCCTFEKVHWRFGGQVALSDLLALGFIGCYLVLTPLRVSRTVRMLLRFFLIFVAVYLIGVLNLHGSAALDQFVKGFVKFLIHFTFLALAVAWLSRRGQDYYWRALGWFSGGIAVNAAYGLLQLLAARVGVNLDSLLISPLTRGASKINVYGAVNHVDVYRPNAISGDPNHLAIMLIVPLLVLTPIYLRLEPTHRLKRRLALMLALMLLVEVATLSRSGILGLAVGAVILGLPYRRYLKSYALLRPMGWVLAVVAVVIASRIHFFLVVFRSRIAANHASTHFQVYSFIPTIMGAHPLFGLGLNNFSIFYQRVTGKTNWGPHSFYVSLIVETGLVGAVLFAAFLVWVFARLSVARSLGNALVAEGDPLGRRVRPLAWGWTAALAGTMAANAFYLTMSFYYFYVFLALALVVPIVFRTPGFVERPAPKLVWSRSRGSRAALAADAPA